MKIVNLKNNLKAEIKLSESEELNSLFAYDENNKVVGFCYFSLFHTYHKSAPESFRLSYAKKHKINVEDAPTTYNFKININSTEKFTVNNNTITFENGKSYDYDKIVCKINEIEIVDERYFKVGLGKALLTEVENFALNHNCKTIKGKYLPKGNFYHGTHQFYQRNGFKFENENNETMIIKTL